MDVLIGGDTAVVVGFVGWIWVSMQWTGMGQYGAKALWKMDIESIVIGCCGRWLYILDSAHLFSWMLLRLLQCTND
eukprot:scaffold8976_cov126-Cylindrotheca_fusiformis.AAC.1